MATVTVVVQPGMREWQLVSETVANPVASDSPKSPPDPGTETPRSAVRSQSPQVPSGTETTRSAVPEKAPAAASGAETIAERRGDTRRRRERHYCLWSAPGIGGPGPGVYSGQYPAVWSAILAQGKGGKYAGSGLVLEKFASLDLAKEGWVVKCPQKHAKRLPAEPSVFKY